MELTKIVITGGPCAGKTTAMSKIQSEFTKMGYHVVFVPETATELIGSGISPQAVCTNSDYQQVQLMLQLEKEKIYECGAGKLSADKVLVVFDRGTLDNKAYMTETEFYALLEKLGTNEVELRDRYDAVFHLVSAAKGAKEFYTTANNNARTESAEQAAELDDKIISAWTGHPHLRVIDNSSDFETKMKKLVAEISSFLGEPEPFEIERKFLIEYPDVDWLESLPNCQKIEIIQTYLESEDGEETRVRQRGMNGHYIYFQTTKKKISDIKRVEIERRLTQDEYLKLLMDSDTSKRQIRKNRYCLTYKNQYFEIDVYPFWNDKAIVELELCDEDAEIIFPDEIKVIKEVTDDDSFKNSSLATIN